MSKIDNEAAVKTPAPVWRARLIALAVTLAATLIAWVIANAAGVEPVASQPGQEPIAIGIAHVASSVAVFGGAGWLARALLDRFAKTRAVLLWRIGAIVVFLLEFFPVILAEATAGTKIFLVILHVIVAAILIPVLGRRLPHAEN